MSVSGTIAKDYISLDNRASTGAPRPCAQATSSNGPEGVKPISGRGKTHSAAQAAGVPPQMLPCVPTRAGPHQHFLHEWETFAQLSTDRPVGVTHGAIPWTSIGRHTARHGIAGDDFNRLCRL